MHRRFRGDRRRVLFDGETAMHFSMFETLYGSLGHDERIERHVTSSWAGGPKAPIDSLCRMMGASASDFVPYGKAKWQKWDLYVSSCFDNPWFARSVPWVDTFHGVGEKWVADGSRLYMCHPLAARYDRLLCPSPRLADQFERHPEFLKHADSLRRTGVAKTDPLVWHNKPDVRRKLQQGWGLLPGRPTVLFAPTWGPDGLLALHGEAVIRECAARGMNVLVKLHSCSYDKDPRFNGGVNWMQRMDSLCAETSAVHCSQSNLASLMLAADVMIADFGSAAVEFCLLDRPLVFFRSDAQSIRTGGDGFQFRQLCDAGGGVTDRKMLADAIDKARKGDDGRSAARHEVQKGFFFNVGRATEQCLVEMYALMNLGVSQGLSDQYRQERERAILSEPARCL